MAFEDYLVFDFWFPVFVAIFSIFLAWFFVRLLEEDDKDEDGTLTEKIKNVLNPDKVATVPFVSENMKEEDDVDYSNTELKKEILIPEDELTEEEMENETRTQQEQLQSIFKLMETDKEIYGMTSFADVKEEMKRYQTG